MRSVVVGIVLCFAAMTVFAAVSINFDDLPSYTPAQDIDVPGVSFSGNGYVVRNVGSLIENFTENGLIGQYSGGPLTITFDSLQSDASFDYVILENPLQVIAKRDGDVVATYDFTGDTSGVSYSLVYAGFASIHGSFDELVLTDMGICPGCVGIDNLETTNSKDAPDNRLNWGYGDANIGILYPGEDAIDLYLYSTDQYITNFITTADIPATPPAENTIIRQEGNVSVSILTTGEIQFNLGPDAEGKSYVYIVADIYGASGYGYKYDPNE
ncbi:hypothetical protein G4Y79_03935 [Phototrophicus methaneseepsis]|uniref:Uncharacterized protein n=1 Tax=Phototrophicus methaneseepsis TaxID=2710758 RepID=A0A7S8EB39_9CHLR|nr:hypothetical protein [Phototrophicus methaneseepsis]QPC83543.1 hypothetical protein G4Y79_03935 [Phototrophicus methaneseepsis]